MSEVLKQVKGKTQKEYNRDYQNKIRKEKDLEYFGCLMPKKDKEIIMKEIKDSGMTIKAYIFSKIAQD